jgi:hypothetical protein
MYEFIKKWGQTPLGKKMGSDPAGSRQTRRTDPEEIARKRPINTYSPLPVTVVGFSAVSC